MKTHPTTIIALAFLSISCGGAPAPEPSEPEVAPAPRVEALLLSGGDRKAKNHNSHLTHVRRVTDLLLSAGLPREAITIFAGDGADEAADLAVREPGDFADHWLIAGTNLGDRLGPPVRYVNSEVEGMRLLPAKKAALETWFQLRASGLRRGDTLLIYVTDHGNRGSRMEPVPTISLWGERLGVAELTRAIDTLAPGVRVVMWMSQCYSGAFARAIYREDERLREDICGFFSTLEELPAWGCYPEALEDTEARGHTARFLDELEPGSELAAAHSRVLLTDRTPNVPHRTSDRYLAGLVSREAERQEVKADDLVDTLLEEAWTDPAAFGAQLDTVRALATRAGLESARFLRELRIPRVRLAKHNRRGRTFRERWTRVLDDTRKPRMARFIATHPAWKGRNLGDLLGRQGVKPETEKEEEEARTALIEQLLDELGTYLDRSPGTRERLDELHGRRVEASSLSIRMKEREGAIFRIQTILRSIAGEVLARRDPDQLADLTRLRGCERWALPEGAALEEATDAAAPAPTITPREEPPTLAEDLERLEALQPAWLGVEFVAEHPNVKLQHRLGAGAVRVQGVVAGSSAQKAGIRVGDTIFGGPEGLFRNGGALRTMVTMSSPGRPLDLDVLRDGERHKVTVTLEPYPDKPPPRRRGPQPGQEAPPRKGLTAVKGTLPAAPAPVLLMFFTTWCGPCKLAMEPLIAYEKEHGVPVILVSREDRSKLESWVKGYPKPLPKRVAHDPLGVVSAAFRARQYPTFVLIDGAEKIADVRKGYSPKVGLPTLK